MHVDDDDYYNDWNDFFVCNDKWDALNLSSLGSTAKELVHLHKETFLLIRDDMVNAFNVAFKVEDHFINYCSKYSSVPQTMREVLADYSEDYDSLAHENFYVNTDVTMNDFMKSNYDTNNAPFV